MDLVFDPDTGDVYVKTKEDPVYYFRRPVGMTVAESRSVGLAMSRLYQLGKQHKANEIKEVLGL